MERIPDCSIHLASPFARRPHRAAFNEYEATKPGGARRSDSSCRAKVAAGALTLTAGRSARCVLLARGWMYERTAPSDHGLPVRRY